jgi:Rps23 Pro-64 3,4-dihydroxylase Tpa1-like proline 4-hydroxylase
MHTDFSIHPNMPHMTRRINLLVFLEDEWQKEWGGVLYLGRNREVEILPLFNHTAIFETSSKSYHGHPEPIAGAHLRRSLAVYFYAPRRPDDDLLSTTVWLSDTNPNDWTIVR